MTNLLTSSVNLLLLTIVLLFIFILIIMLIPSKKVELIKQFSLFSSLFIFILTLNSSKYEIIFFCGDYFKNIKNLSEPFFIDDVIIRFGINNDKEHYHVPLLVSPWSYSTYRGG